TEFIDNREAADTPATATAEQRKQDCELKAFRRLAKSIRQDFPQLPICFTGDSQFCCGAGFQVAKDYHAAYVYVFKEGRMPAVWADFQGLLSLCPDQRVVLETPQRVRQVYRWVAAVSYTDSANRPWTFQAIHCAERHADGSVGQWAWAVAPELT